MLRALAALLLLFALGALGCSHLPRAEQRSVVPAAAPASAPAPVSAPWPHEASDLKPDPAIAYGRLPNGLRYTILPHSNPRERVSVCLLVQAGGFHARKSEFDYAHYVEHMAFRDTRDFPGDTAIQAMQSLGVQFGAHVNATAGLFETDYRFGNIPTDRPDALSTALRILRSMADGVRFERDAVKRERGVMLGEHRRDPGSSEFWRDELDFLSPRDEKVRWHEWKALYGGTVVGKPAPFLWPVFWRPTAEGLRAFYDRWYRPERMILAVVGDIQPAAVEELVRATFATLAGRGPAPQEPAIHEAALPATKETPRIAISADARAPAVRLALARAHPQTEPDTADRRRQGLARRLALDMLDRRLDREAEVPAPPFTSAGTLLSYTVPGRALVLVRASAPAADWPKALTTLDRETRRALADGFAASEFAGVVEQERARTANTTQSSAEIARGLAFGAARGVVRMAPAAEGRLHRTQLAALTVEDCNQALRELLPAGGIGFAVGLGGTPEKKPVKPALVRATLHASQAAPLAAYQPPPATKPFPYTDFGPPGQVVKRSRHAILDAELVEFANGVRLNVKRTDFEPGRVHLNVEIAGGRLATPADKPGLYYRFPAWIYGGLRDVSSEDERALNPALFIERWFSQSDDRFGMAGRGPVAKLLPTLQNYAAYVAFPAMRDDAWPRALEIARQKLGPREASLEGIASDTLWRRLTGGHPAMVDPTIVQVSQRTPEEFKPWFQQLLATAPLEIAIVGDIAPEAAIEAVARTFGALPARSTSDPFGEQRRMTYPPKPFAETFSGAGSKFSAIVNLAWPAPRVVTAAQRHQGLILGRILADRLRLKLRAEMGETYSPDASFGWIGHATGKPAFLACIVEAAPGRAERVADAARTIAEILARNGATDEEFERARRPLVRETESVQRDNKWWLDALARAQASPEEAGDNMGILDHLQSATRADVNALARQIIVTETFCRLIVRAK